MGRGPLLFSSPKTVPKWRVTVRSRGWDSCVVVTPEEKRPPVETPKRSRDVETTLEDSTSSQISVGHRTTDGGISPFGG